MWRRPFPWIITLAALLFALVPYATDDVQLRESLVLAAVYIVLASNLNLMIGYAGYVNFGNIVFFGLGGYFCLFLVSDWRWQLLPAALAAGVSVSALALLFGLGILRLRGAFFALATIGVNAAIQQLVTNFEPWGGATGIYLALDAYGPLGGPMQALWTVYLLIVAAMLALAAGELRHQAIQVRSRPLGDRTKRGRGGGARGADAVLQGARLQRLRLPAGDRRRPVFLQERHHRAGRRLQPVALHRGDRHGDAGRPGHRAGPALGAFLYEELRRFLLTAEAFANFQLVIAGALLLIIVLFVPGGLMGFVHRRWPRTQQALE